MARKQAVLLIHGIGEQRPMDTLRGFVDAVWTTDSNVRGPHAGSESWSKPDNVSRSFELRRLTTRRNTAEIRTDFFEFYWAHLMHGTTYGHLLAWARSLLLRRPGTVPRPLRGVYWLLWAALGLALALAIYSAVSAGSEDAMRVPAWLSGLLSIAILPAMGAVLNGVVGDAARYLHVAPANIQRRHEVRQAGVDLLAELHNRNYDRIIVVGHSLGSVIGYDILYHAWASLHDVHDEFATKLFALQDLERHTIERLPSDSLESFRIGQRAFVEELRQNGNPWRVTDFVTIGSPLAHASLLLANGADDLAAKQRARELPTCPPQLETSTKNGQKMSRFSFEHGKSPFRVAHHAAVFAATRWTNIYFPCRFVLWGDVIGGPLAPWFGDRIQDVSVETSLRRGLLSHTLYWTQPPEGEAPHLESLRAALNLLDR